MPENLWSGTYEVASRRQANFSCYPKEHPQLSITVLIGDSRAPFKKLPLKPPLQTLACLSFF